MSTTYSLQFLNQSFQFDNKVEIYHSKINDSTLQYFVFLDGKLYRYTFGDSNWRENLLLSVPNAYNVLYFPKSLKDKKSLLLLKVASGINFYRYEDSEFKLLRSSDDYSANIFSSYIDWSKPENIIKSGHFYSDKTYIGILTKHKLHKLKFHVVWEENFELGKYPLLTLDYTILDKDDTTKAHFFLADLKSEGQENIIVHNRTGLNIYEFDNNNELRHIRGVPNSSKTNDFKENLFFPNLTGQALKDILLFNNSGLFLYQYNVKQDEYLMINYNPLFDEQRGWNDEYIHTIRFEDINFDGKQEMFFTGPQGMDILSFDYSTLQWKSLLDVSSNAIPERHGKILEIASQSFTNTGYPIVFTQYLKKMHWAQIVKRPLAYDVKDTSSQEYSTDNSAELTIIPELTKTKVADKDKSIIFLRDQLDYSSIINGVDKDTGKAIFKVPLIGLPNFSKEEKLNLYYNGNNKDSTILGVGWTFPINAIVMDNQGSIFPENERYILLLEDFPQLLIMDSNNSTDDVYIFKLSDQNSNTRIRYFKNKERWEIDYKGIKQIYGCREGSNDDSISYDLAWKLWRGVGSSPSDQVELATAWFLIELRSGENHAIYYTYDITNVSVPVSGKRFTREVYLKTISDDRGNEIIFKYAKKDPQEFNVPSVQDADGNYNTKKVQTRYLEGYSINTYNYRQDINFIYDVKKGKRFLTIIQQQNDFFKSVLQFSYKKILNSYELEKVILPTAASVEFTYKIMEDTDLLSDIIENVDFTCEVSENYRVDYGQDFVLVSYINSYHHVVLKMFDRKLTNKMYSPLSNSKSRQFPFLGKNSVKHYEVKVLEKSLVFILDYEEKKDLCFMQKEKDKWSFKPTYYNYDKDVTIQFGLDFIVLLNTKEDHLEIYTWNKKSEKWDNEIMKDKLSGNSKDSLLVVSDKVFFLYDDYSVILGYRNEEHKWRSKSILTLPDFINRTESTLRRFDLNTDIHNQLMRVLKKGTFQVRNNFLLFNKWTVQDTKLFSEIIFFVLNSKYEVGAHNYYLQFQDDITQISYEESINLNDKIKTYFTLGYKKNRDQFKIFLKKFTENGQKNINNYCQDNKECASDLEQKIQKQVSDSYKKSFLIDFRKYLAYIQSSTVICGNVKYTFIGDKWKNDTVTEKDLKPERWSIFLDDKFVLKKRNSQSSIKLYDKNKTKGQKPILDLEVKNINEIFNRYPKYLVYAMNSKTFKVVFYELVDNGMNKTFTLPRGETLSSMSDYNILVTHGKRSDNERLTLNFRQFFSLKTKLPNPVITELTVNFDNDYKRKTGYDYDQLSAKVLNNILFYEKTYIIPSNNKSAHGFIEKSILTNKIYDSQEKLIKIIHKENSSNVTNHVPGETESRNSTLFDVTGHLEVAQFYPYEMQDDEVGYYGFEDYEVNRISAVNSENRWFFNESYIKKQEFSLTGENHLLLNNYRLIGTFQPRNQIQNYVASCWIRSQETGLEIGTVTPYLKAVVYSEDNQQINGYLSEIKFRYDDWNYLEVVIDLFYSKQIFKNLVSSTELDLTEKPLKIEVIVSPSVNSTLDVDNIRFSPLNSDFQAITYNTESKEIKEVMNANGLIKRYLYNDYQHQFASISENGEIEKLNSYTKASSVNRIKELKSKIQIQPNEGFYEDFNPFSFTKRWAVNNTISWKISPSEIHHIINNLDQLKLRNMHDTFNSYGIRLYFSLQSESSRIEFADLLQLKRRGTGAIITLSTQIRVIPTNGEMLLIAEGHRLMIWIDGGLYFDVGDHNTLNKLLYDIKMFGKVKIRDVLVFFEPRVHVTYFNALGEKIQEINLESADSAIITEFLYDEVGRQCISTKATRLQRFANQTVVNYYHDFVTNKDPLKDDSVWKLGQIMGAFENLKPYNYYQVTYNNNPLSETSAIGLPGEEFSVRGKYAKRFSSTTNHKFINQFYPINQNYRHYVEHKIDGTEDVKVFDKRNNTVATLIRAPGEYDLLATYEYNDNGELIQTLSPLFHKKARTIYKLGSELLCLPKENSEEQNLFRDTKSYDKMGNIISKTTADSGKVEFLYNDSGQLKFNIFYSSFNSTAIENIVYFDYDYLGRLIHTGKLISPPAKEKLLNLTLTKNNTEEYQLFYHSDFERDPTLRGRLKRSVTYNDGIPFIEESLLNEDKSFSSKRIIKLNENSNDYQVIVTNKNYRAGKLVEIEYPVDVRGTPFKVTYNYDKLSRIQEIRLPGTKHSFVMYTYNPEGLIETEHHLPNQINFNFTRKYYYNSASYLTRLEDKFLNENIYYTEGSYGDHGYGDGTITRTEFEATWHQYADNDKISLNEKSFISNSLNPEESKLCFNKLKTAGYINQYNRQAKIYYPRSEIFFPRNCTVGSKARHIQNILGKKGFPAKYGHLYNYGAYQELIKAKYFVGKDIPAPLQPDTFTKMIPEVNVTTSRKIWKILNNGNYVIADRAMLNEASYDNLYFKPHGKKGSTSIIRSTLSNDLKDIIGENYFYPLILENALAFYFSTKQDLSTFKSNLNQTFSQKGNEILKMLEEKNYFENPLSEEFNQLLENHQSIIPKIVKVLLEYFSKELLEAEFDVEAYEIDENGNHKHFYSGFERYVLEYGDNSNQIKNINFSSSASSKYGDFFIKHDSRGNVVQALHKEIKYITYHPVSNRATSIELVNGKKILFQYDAQGERAVKKVLDSTGKVKKEVHYVRDEFGRSLVEREVIWSSPTLPPSVLITVFIYGPKGLIGFIRRDEYYSVITDHEGSIRLVVKDGEVVAAYDYLPYGNLMRQYGTNSEAHISYRYTGQEWDEETDLYNYHARFYDPSIGRFYQHDPKMQYFSPYKYAGNSPVSVIDPDGEFAFLIFFVITLGVLGAYLGGASASGYWNPAMWDYKDPKLYSGIVFGAIGGALVPITLPESLAAISILGGLGIYGGMAASAREWNPLKWDFSRPELWNGGFTGFAAFSGIRTGISQSINIYKSLSIGGKIAFITSSTSFAGVSIMSKFIDKELDFSKPDLYYDIFESLVFAADLPTAVIGGHRFLKEKVLNVIEGIKYRKSLRTAITGHQKWMLHQELRPHSVWKNAAKFLVGITIPNLAGVFVSAAYNEDGFDFKRISTYQNFINGVMMASGLGFHADLFYQKRIRLPRKQRVADDLRDLAQISIDNYRKEFKTIKYEEIYKNQKSVIENIKKFGEDIPNTVVSVAKMKNGVVFVAYSGLEGPGYYSFFLKGLKEKKPIIEEHKLKEHNNEVASQNIALNDDADINSAVHEAIDTKVHLLKELNYNKFLIEQDTWKSTLMEAINSVDQINNRIINHYFNGQEMTNIIHQLADRVRENGFISDKSVIVNKIKSRILHDYNQNKKSIISVTKNLETLNNNSERTSTRVSTIDTLLAGLESRLGIKPVHIDLNGEFSITKDLLKRRLSTVKTRQNQLEIGLNNLDNIKDNIQLSQLFEEHKVKYSKGIEGWPRTNCAEPHIISAITRSKDIFSNAHASEKYDVFDIKYLAAYNVHQQKLLPALSPKIRCSNCQETTKIITNVITDPEWKLTLTNELKNKLVTNYYTYNKNITRAHNIANKGNDNRARKRRSTGSNYINGQDSFISKIDERDSIPENYENNSQIVENDKSINNVREQSKNFATNLFGWMRTSWNQLFDSKKILPEKATIPNALNGITHSNNSLTVTSAFVDVNGTILLLDMMMRKITGEKYISGAADRNIPLLEARGYLLDVGLAFDKAIKYAASKSGISMHRFNIHYIDIQDKVNDKIMSRRLDEIADILISHVKKVCPHREKGCPGKLSQKKFSKFINEFSARIESELNDIMQINRGIKGMQI